MGPNFLKQKYCIVHLENTKRNAANCLECPKAEIEKLTQGKMIYTQGLIQTRCNEMRYPL